MCEKTRRAPTAGTASRPMSTRISDTVRFGWAVRVADPAVRVVASRAEATGAKAVRAEAARAAAAGAALTNGLGEFVDEALAAKALCVSSSETETRQAEDEAVAAVGDACVVNEMGSQADKNKNARRHNMFDGESRRVGE